VAFSIGNLIRSFFLGDFCFRRWLASRKTLSRMRIRTALAFSGTPRAGRVTAVAGIPGQPNLYYAGTPNGGVWKSDYAGSYLEADLWTQCTSRPSAPLPSHLPMQIYLCGDRRTRQRPRSFQVQRCGSHVEQRGIGSKNIHQLDIVDPTNPDVVIAGAFGSAVPSEPRGLSNHGWRKSWTKTLTDATALPE